MIIVYEKKKIEEEVIESSKVTEKNINEPTTQEKIKKGFVDLISKMDSSEVVQAVNVNDLDESIPGRESYFEEDNVFSVFLATFLRKFEANLEDNRDYSEQTVKVSEVLGKLARLYERVRNIVEYKGEHVLRRNAIERILKRLVWEHESIRTNVDFEKISETLLKELIWARYLENDFILKSKIKEVEGIVRKYVYIISNLKSHPQGVPISKVRKWLWGIASSEIEDNLDPSNREMYVQLMYRWFMSYFEWKENNLSESEKKIQIYLAIHRAFPKSDEPIMRYNLLIKKIKNWTNISNSDLDLFIRGFSSVYKEIEGHLNYSGRYVIYRKIQRQTPAFDIFKSVASLEGENLRNCLEDEKTFEQKIKQVCSVKYRQIKKRVNTGIVRSIVYIFITKVFLALVLEVPYEVWRYGDIRYFPLTINLIFPPILMWIIGFSIKIPGEKNTKTIISMLKSVVYRSDATKKRLFTTVDVRKSSALVKVFSYLYALLFVLILGGISYLLFKINFTLLGVAIFFGFISLVLLFAYRVRYHANQLKVESDTESFIGHLFSFLTLPFLNIGVYLSKGLSALNFFTIILDFLIEAPLKSIIELFEEWTTYLKEKREEVVEIPED